MATAILSGGVITDAARAARTANDGRAAPDSSVGVWEARTNLCPNPNATTNLIGWSALGTAGSLTRVAGGWAAVGATSFDLAATFTGGNTEAWIDCPITDAAATYACSVVVYAPPGDSAIGKSASIVLTELGGASASVNHVASVVIAAGENRITLVTALANSDRTTLRPRVRITPATTGDHLRFGALMLTKSAYAQPYAETSAAAGRVQLPASGLSPVQGWLALRARMEMDPLNAPAEGVTFFHSDDGALALTWQAGVFTFTRTDGAATETAIARGTWVSGQELLVAARWSAAGSAVSVGGQPFLTAESRVFQDDFARPDADTLGTAPTGQTYRHDGQIPGIIVSERYQRPLPVANHTCYEQITLPDRPILQHIAGSFSGTYGPFSAVVAINAAVDAPYAAGQTYLNGMVHGVFSVYQSYVTIYHDNLHDGILTINYPNIPGVTALDTSAGSPTNGVSCLLTDGTVYDFTIAMDWTANTITMTVTQGDTLVGAASATDARISQYGGRYTVWQSYFDTGLATADAVPRLEAVDATIAVSDPTTPVIPDGGLTTIDLGSAGGASAFLNGEILWAAAGRGSLSPRDLTRLNRRSAGDARWGDVEDQARLAAVWPAIDTTLTGYPVEASRMGGGLQSVPPDGRVQRFLGEPGVIKPVLN